MKKITVVLLALVLLISFTQIPASALTFGPDEEQMLASGILNEKTAVWFVRSYFSQRESFLRGETDQIPLAILPIVNDEMLHRDKMAACQLTLISSAVSVESVSKWDDRVEICAAESVTYADHAGRRSGVVSHTIVVYQDHEGDILVSSDAYRDAAAGFDSCSYVNEAAAASLAVALGGSDSCIIYVAKGEVGTTEGAGGYTKYGEFFGMPTCDWCGAFVGWCASKAKVPNDVILHSAYVIGIRDFFAARGAYFTKWGSGSSFMPRPGDLFFQNGSAESPGHMGIVAAVEGNLIYVIDGNSSDRVNYRPVPLTQSDLVGFARPDYTMSDHSYTGAWYSNINGHWRVCINCGCKGEVQAHRFKWNAARGVYICLDCGYETKNTMVDF